MLIDFDDAADDDDHDIVDGAFEYDGSCQRP